MASLEKSKLSFKKNKAQPLQKSYLSKDQSRCKIQLSEILCHEIKQIIKYDMKKYRIGIQLEQDMKKHIQNSKINKICHQEKAKEINKKNLTEQISKLDKYFQKKSIEQELVSNKNKLKQNQLENKKLIKKQKFNNVLNNYNSCLEEDIKCRLSRIQSSQSNGKQNYSKIRSSQQKNRYTYSTNHRYKILRQKQEEMQTKKVSQYLKKMKKCQSHAILHEIQNNSRREKSMKAQVRCLVANRTLLEESRRLQLQQRYQKNQKLHMKKINFLKQNKFEEILRKSQLKKILCQTAKVNKENQIKNTINIWANNYQNKFHTWKEQYKKNINVLSNKLNKNLAKKTYSELNAKAKQKIFQSNKKYLYQTIQKIKNFSQNQKLSEKDRKKLLSLLFQNQSIDKKLLQEFLSQDRISYIKKKIQQEKLQSQKIKKIKRLKNNPIL